MNIRARDVYSGYTKDQIKMFLYKNGWKIVAFREPVGAELFISRYGYPIRESQLPLGSRDISPRRLIIEKIP